MLSYKRGDDAVPETGLEIEQQVLGILLRAVVLLFVLYVCVVVPQCVVLTSLHLTLPHLTSLFPVHPLRLGQIDFERSRHC